MKTPTDMKCAACGWWPPMVRVRESRDRVRVRVVPASESWRWRKLRDHIYELAHEEFYRGPHNALVLEMER